MLEKAPTIPQIRKQKTLACSSSWLYLDTWNALEFLTPNTSTVQWAQLAPPWSWLGGKLMDELCFLLCFLLCPLYVHYMSIVICYYYCSSNLVTCITRTTSGKVEYHHRKRHKHSTCGSLGILSHYQQRWFIFGSTMLFIIIMTLLSPTKIHMI